MKNKIKSILKVTMWYLLLAFVIIATWEFVRPDVVSMVPDNSISIERVIVEQDLTPMELLENTQRAKDAGSLCQTNEAKQIRLEEIAEEAKELQSSLK